MTRRCIATRKSSSNGRAAIRFRASSSISKRKVTTSSASASKSMSGRTRRSKRRWILPKAARCRNLKKHLKIFTRQRAARRPQILPVRRILLTPLLTALGSHGSHLHQGDQFCPARGNAAGRERVRHGRGRCGSGRRVQGHRGVARRLRRGACDRQSHFGGAYSRRGNRGGGARDAAGGRDAVRGFHFVRL